MNQQHTRRRLSVAPLDRMSHNGLPGGVGLELRNKWNEHPKNAHMHGQNCKRTHKHRCMQSHRQKHTHSLSLTSTKQTPPPLSIPHASMHVHTCAPTSPLAHFYAPKGFRTRMPYLPLLCLFNIPPLHAHTLSTSALCARCRHFTLACNEQLHF